MPNILAIDTSGLTMSVCILSKDKIIAETTVTNKRDHSTTLLPAIESILVSTDMNIKDIDYFALATGPGSYTGLRIGIGTIKGLCQPHNKKIIGINTLTGLAFNVKTSLETIICPIIDARRNRVYTALFTNTLDEILPPQVINIDELLTKTEYDNIIFVGDGVDKYKSVISDKLGDKAKFAETNNNTQRASSIALLAVQNIDKAQTAAEINIDYMNKTQAEQNLERKNR